MGLFLVTDGERRLAVLIGRRRYPSQRYFVEVMASEQEEGGRLTRSILGAGTDGTPAPPVPTGFPDLRGP